MTTRRVVRVTDACFEQVDDALGIDRGPNGEPAASLATSDASIDLIGVTIER